jgi:hypothetical protein
MKTSKTLSPKQKKIAQMAGDPNKIEGEDFKKLKPMKANEGVGIDKARKHKQFVKEKLDTAKGYAKEMLGISSKDDTAEKLGRAVGAGAGTGGASAATLKYFLDNSKRSKDRLTPRDYEINEKNRREF